MTGHVNMPKKSSGMQFRLTGARREMEGEWWRADELDGGCLENRCEIDHHLPRMVLVAFNSNCTISFLPIFLLQNLCFFLYSSLKSFFQNIKNIKDRPKGRKTPPAFFNLL